MNENLQKYWPTKGHCGIPEPVCGQFIYSHFPQNTNLLGPILITTKAQRLFLFSLNFYAYFSKDFNIKEQ